MEDTSEAREFTFILAGKLGVGKSSIFKRIQTGSFSEYPSIGSTGKADGELEHYIYRTTLDGIEYTVSLMSCTVCNRLLINNNN